MIEEGFINLDISKKIIENYLNNPILKNIKSLILACTHYPLIKYEIKQFYKNKINIINSVNIVTQHISDELTRFNLLNNKTDPEYMFYVSNYTSSFEKSARFFFREKIKLEEINLHLYTKKNT